jgi:hypothetical protein
VPEHRSPARGGLKCIPTSQNSMTCLRACSGTTTYGRPTSTSSPRTLSREFVGRQLSDANERVFCRSRNCSRGFLRSFLCSNDVFTTLLGSHGFRRTSSSRRAVVGSPPSCLRRLRLSIESPSCSCVPTKTANTNSMPTSNRGSIFTTVTAII